MHACMHENFAFIYLALVPLHHYITRAQYIHPFPKAMSQASYMRAILPLLALLFHSHLCTTRLDTLSTLCLAPPLHEPFQYIITALTPMHAAPRAFASGPAGCHRTQDTM